MGQQEDSFIYRETHFPYLMRRICILTACLVLLLLAYAGAVFASDDDQNGGSSGVQVREHTSQEHRFGTTPAMFMILFLVGMGIADRLADARKRNVQARVIAQNLGYTVR